MDVSGEGFGCLNFIAPKLTPWTTSQIFETENQGKEIKENAETQINELYRQIGKLKVERDFLVDRSVQLGLPTEKPW